MSSAGGRPRNVELDASILDATIALLRERGYSGLRVDDIAAVSGSAKTTIYRRWPTVRHLVVAAMERAVGAVPEATGDGAVQRLEQLLLARSEALDTQALLGVALDLLRSDDAELRQRYRQRVVDPARARVIALIEAAVAEGVVTPQSDPVDLADALIGGLVYRTAVLGEGVSAQRTADLVEAVLAGSSPSARRSE